MTHKTPFSLDERDGAFQKVQMAPRIRTRTPVRFKFFNGFRLTQSFALQPVKILQEVVVVPGHEVSPLSKQAGAR